MFKAITQPIDNNYLKWDPHFARIRTRAFEKAQQYIDNEVLRRDDPLVPSRTGTLRRSGMLNTKIGSGRVIYSTPYARKLYYDPKRKDGTPYRFNGAPQRGPRWFSRMKAGNRDAILKGAAQILRRG